VAQSPLACQLPCLPAGLQAPLLGKNPTGFWGQRFDICHGSVTAEMISAGDAGAGDIPETILSFQGRAAQHPLHSHFQG